MLDTPKQETEVHDTARAEQPPLKRYGVIAALIAAGVVGYGAYSRHEAATALEGTARDAAVPDVAVVRPQGAAEADALVLPGNVEAFNSAAIYARTNGYVRNWLVDIGDHVRSGQALATLDAPEVDQQLTQARADYNTAVANRRLAQTSADRWRAMLQKDAVSKQETDERLGDLAARTAMANGALANVRRLEALQGFTRLRAPFDGIVTSRSAQIGALVSAGNASAQPLFTVSDIRRMRIYVRVPQGYATEVRPGTQATMTLPEYPQRTFDATVTRTARAIDRQSGAILVQLEAPNPDGALLPGAFAQVRFSMRGMPGSVRVPGSAILYRSEGPAIAIMGNDGVARVRNVTIARDEGKTVMLSSGVSASDRVIDSPPDSIRSGDHVRAAAEPGKTGGKDGGR